MGNHGSKILCQESETRNGNIPLPPAKGKIKLKPGIAHKNGGNDIQFANWIPSHQKNRGQIKRNKPSRCVNRKRTSKDKVGQHGEEKKSADDNRTGYLVCMWHSYFPLRGSHALRNTAYRGRTEGTRITSADHCDTTLIQAIPVKL